MQRHFFQTSTSHRGFRASFSFLLFIFYFNLFFPAGFKASAQDKEQYILGENKNLEMIVYIIGEIQKPGEYRVTDRTNIAELIAKASGPNDFSNMKAVTITRYDRSGDTQDLRATESKSGKQCIHVDMNAHFKAPQSHPAPILQPGDIVLIPKNGWNKWKNIASVTRDIAVVASAYFLYLRAERN